MELSVCLFNRIKGEEFFGEGIENLRGVGISANGGNEEATVRPGYRPDLSVGENPGVPADRVRFNAGHRGVVFGAAV